MSSILACTSGYAISYSLPAQFPTIALGQYSDVWSTSCSEPVDKASGTFSDSTYNGMYDALCGAYCATHKIDGSSLDFPRDWLTKE